MGQRFKRILLKLSGEYLGGQKGQGFDPETVLNLSELICQIQKRGIEIGIVLGGGNFFRGAKASKIKMNRVSGDQIGMLATVMNSMCLKESLLSMNQKCSLMTGLPMPLVAESFNRQKAVKCLEEGEIVIFGGGTGNPYFSTDSAAALRALEINADIVIKGTKVDGVYDKDPVTNSDAIKFDKLDYTEVLKRDLKVMDATAIALLRENNLPLCVLDITNDKDLIGFLDGKAVGTLVE